MWCCENKKDIVYLWILYFENFFGMVVVKIFNFVGYCVDL